MKYIQLLALFACVGMVTGCDKKEEAPDEAPVAAAPAEAPKPAEPEFKPTGIKECDAFLKFAAACMEEMPESAKVMMMGGVKQMRDGIVKATANPGMRDLQASTCMAQEKSYRDNPMCKSLAAKMGPMAEPAKLVFTPNTGIPECDEALKLQFECSQLKGELGEVAAKMLYRGMADSYAADADDPKKAKKAKRVCKFMKSEVRRTKECKSLVK